EPRVVIDLPHVSSRFIAPVRLAVVQEAHGKSDIERLRIVNLIHFLVAPLHAERLDVRFYVLYLPATDDWKHIRGFVHHVGEGNVFGNVFFLLASSSSFLSIRRYLSSWGPMLRPCSLN